jgi:hypothetical protein
MHAFDDYSNPTIYLVCMYVYALHGIICMVIAHRARILNLCYRLNVIGNKLVYQYNGSLGHKVLPWSRPRVIV